MWAVVRCGWMAGVVLLAASVEAESPPDDRSLSLAIAIRKAEESQVQLEELKMAFRKLMTDHAALQSELEEKEQAVKTLSETLAVAQNESALLRQRWQDAQLKLARPAGVGQSNTASGVIASEAQLADALAALGKAESDRAKLAEEMARLNAVLDVALRGSGNISPIQRAQALAENERVKGLLAARTAEQAGASARTATTAPDVKLTLDTGQVLNLNWGLQLAVINLGESHGVRLGMPFKVVRGDRIIGHLKVVEVRRKISGAVIEWMDKQLSIQVGDRVRVTKS